MRGVLVLLLLIPAVLFGQESEPAKMNTLLPAKAKAPAANPNYTYMEINRSLFEDGILQPGTHFLFESAPGTTEELVVTSVNHYLPGTTSVTARRTREVTSEFAITYSEGRLTGQLSRAGQKTKYLGYQTETASGYITENLDTDFLPDIGGETLKRTGSLSFEKTKKKTSGFTGSVPNVKAVSDALEDSTIIDVMIVYTPEAKTFADSRNDIGSIEAAITQAMTLANIVHDNSKTGIFLRLVHSMELNYTEAVNDSTGETDSDLMLTQLTEGTDGFEPVHTARDAYGADIVAFFAKIDDTGGLGWILGSTAGIPELGFSINRIQQVAFNFTLAHEIGHNMGSHHSRTQTEAAASYSGGLFDFSVGYQDNINGYSTVMAYPENQDEIPVFSSPDLFWNGTPMGTDNSVYRENNALSMKYVKRVVAANKPTVVNPPALSPLTNEIQVEMNREDQFTAPVTLTNTGNSLLMWAADFDFPDNIAPKLKSRNDEYVIHRKPELSGFLKNGIPAPTRAASLNKAKNPAGSTVIYETSFENDDDFTLGTHELQNGWVARGEAADFKISAFNSSSGSNHLRYESRGDGKIRGISSPYFGILPFGSYEFEIDFSLTGAGALDDRIDFYMMDDATNEDVAGFIIHNGLFYSFTTNEAGEPTYGSDGQPVIGTGSYYRVKISINPENEQIRYEIKNLADNTSTTVNRGFPEGRKPGSFVFVHDNARSGTTLDIDNIKFSKQDGVYPWLDINRHSGSVAASSSQTLNLNFDTRGMSAGNYYTKLIVQTNDPAGMYNEVPVRLIVNNAVGNEETANGPESIYLGQNYPNPFNPETTFWFSLKEAAQVKLEVFTIQGQKVATVVDAKKTPGVHSVIFNAENLASGVYLYRLQAQGKVSTRKMVLVK